VTVVDLVGRGRGDVAGLAALASRLRRAEALLAGSASPVQLTSVRAAAAAVDTAAQRLRDLPDGSPVSAVSSVEADLAHDLSTLLGSERTF
jgi:hypothetical protein